MYTPANHRPFGAGHRFLTRWQMEDLPTLTIHCCRKFPSIHWECWASPKAVQL